MSAIGYSGHSRGSAGLLAQAAYVCLLVLLVLAAPVPGAAALPGGAENPWTFSYTWHSIPTGAGGGPAPLPPALLAPDTMADAGQRLMLAVTLTPSGESYIYGSASQQADGKPTVVGLWRPDGVSAAAGGVFPPPVRKKDPWQKGAVSSVYTGAFTVFIPVAEAPGAPLVLTATGLACTSSNCTPFTLVHMLEVPLATSGMTLPPQGEFVPGAIWEPAPASAPRGSLPAPATENVASVESARPSLRLGGGGLPQTLSRNSAQGPDVQEGGDGSAAPASRAVEGVDIASLLDQLKPRYFAASLEVASLGQAMLLGFLAGMLLNLMPCVLPVLGLKLSSLMAGMGQNQDDAIRKKQAFRRHQVFFASGILAWFGVLAVLFASLDLAWGQMFQSPHVVLGISLFMLLMALNLFGVFSLPVLDLRSGGSSNPDVQAFSGGLTATLLATPCSGPLLGGVLGWALLQPPMIIVLSLLSVGLGMAGPYLLLALRPGLASRFPRPGPWMQTMEQGLGFLLLAATVYFATLLPGLTLPRVLWAFVVTAFAAWLWGQVGGLRASRRRRGMARAAALCLLSLAFIWPLWPQETRFDWQPYSAESFAATLGTTPMLVEFTADWCPTCKVMEATTLTPARMIAWQRKFGFTAVRVDLTRYHSDGQDLLRRLGSASIPVMALFPAGEGALAPLVLRDVVTPGQLESALRSVFGPQAP